jgi:hypothetical protein
MNTEAARNSSRRSPIALIAFFVLALASGTALAAGGHGGGGGGGFGGGHFGRAPGGFHGHFGGGHFSHHGFDGGAIVLPYPYYRPYGFYDYDRPYGYYEPYYPYCDLNTPYDNPPYC